MACQGDGLFRDDGGDDTKSRRSDERPRARRHLVEHHPERKHICWRATLHAVDALRRHVRRGADDDARHGFERRVRRRVAAAFECNRPGEPEIEHFHESITAEHDVLRLDVAMHDTRAVRGVEGARNLRADFGDSCERHRALEERPQRRAVDQLLDDEVVAFRGLADFVNDNDVRVVQGRGGTGLAQETGDCQLFVLSRTHDLHRDRAVEAGIERPIDLAHAAVAKLRFESIVTKSRWWHERILLFPAQPLTCNLQTSSPCEK